MVVQLEGSPQHGAFAATACARTLALGGCLLLHTSDMVRKELVGKSRGRVLFHVRVVKFIDC
jgi:hypothetical protein